MLRMNSIVSFIKLDMRIDFDKMKLFIFIENIFIYGYSFKDKFSK